MELRADVVSALHVVEEVGDGLRRGVREELDLDDAGGRVELDLRIGGERRRSRRSANAAAARNLVQHERVSCKAMEGLVQRRRRGGGASTSRTSFSLAGAVLLRASRAIAFS